MYNTTRATTFKVLKSFDLRNIRNTVVPVCHNHSIKILFPPVVASFARLPQNDLPFAVDYTDEFHGRAVRHEVLVALSIDETLDIPLDRLPGPERRVCTVSSDRGPSVLTRGRRIILDRPRSLTITIESFELYFKRRLTIGLINWTPIEFKVPTLS